MRRTIKPVAFIYLFLFLISTTVLFEIRGWNHDFIMFFFFAAFMFAYLVPLIFEYHKIDIKNQLKRTRLRLDILSSFIYMITLLFIGFMHVLGNLKFPHFVLIDGWGNGYVIATRIAWFLAAFSSYLFSRSLSVDIHGLRPEYKEDFEMVDDKFRNPSFFEALLEILLFPTISIPVFISIADFLGLSFIRHFVTTFIL